MKQPWLFFCDNFNFKIYYVPKDAKYFYYELLPKNTRGGLAMFTQQSLKINNNGRISML